MCGSMVDIQSAAAEIRRGIKKEDRKKLQGKHIMPASVTQGGHKNGHGQYNATSFKFVDSFFGSRLSGTFKLVP